MDKEMIFNLFKTNHFILNKQVEGLTHEESLLQLPFRGNCLNWVLGHIIVSREDVLSWMGVERSYSEEQTNRYQFDSEPITSADDPDILPLERLMEDFELTQQRLSDAFDEISDAQLAEKDERDRSLSSRILFMAWHEGYHAGQTEYLRQLAGKDDKII